MKILGFLLLAILPSVVAAAEGPPKGGQTRYISPTAKGDRSGKDADNATDLRHIDEMIQRVGPGGVVCLLADAGPFATSDSVTISHGGTAGQPVTVMGVDRKGVPARARITGTRTSPYPTTTAAFAKMNHGSEVFRLNAGADHLRFASLDFQDIGNGAIYVRAKLAGLVLEDISARNVRRFLERSDAAVASITGLTVRRVTVEGFSKSAIRLDGQTSQVLMEDVVGDSQRQDFDNFTEGIDISGQVHDAVFRRCTMRNSQQTLDAKTFWNGDGFTSERDTYNLLFEDCAAEGCTDGGYDLKSSRATLLRCRSAGNTANFKLWGKEQVLMRECISENPVAHGGPQDARHLTAQWGGNITVEKCRFIDANKRAVAFHTEANDEVQPALGCTITVTGSTVKSAGKLSFVDFNSKVSIDGVNRPYDGR